MYKFKIDEIKFRGGVSFEPGALTIFVGPNNSGKSRTLRDIQSVCTGETGRVVLEDVIFPMPETIDALLESYEVETYSDDAHNTYMRGLSATLTSGHNLHVGPAWRENAANYLAQKNVRQFGNLFGHRLLSVFSTDARLSLTRETESSESNQTSSLLQALYNEGAMVESKVRAIVKAAFGKDIKLDYSTLRRLLLRVGEHFEDAPTDPREALSYFRNAEKLDQQGDGIRSFVATVLAMLVGNRPVTLIDEPEAFLHPPQARRLGEFIADTANGDRQVFISTHSSDFLRGVLGRRQDVTIVRVDRDGDEPVVSILNSEDVQKFATDPLLSSTRILDGLFYKGAIIVEADADAIFYERVGRRLPNSDSFHLVHAHNKQTVAKVLYPYISLGIKFAAVVDFDMIRVKEEFSAILREFSFERSEIVEIEGLRKVIVEEIESVSSEDLLGAVVDALRKEADRTESSQESADRKLSLLLGNLKRIRESGTNWKKFKEQGRAGLSPGGQSAFDAMHKICSSRGLFLVPVGELEGWLVNHGIPYTSNKAKWIVEALGKLPSIAIDKDHDPGKFLHAIFEYLHQGSVPLRAEVAATPPVGGEAPVEAPSPQVG